METAKSARALETNLDGYDVGADSECARAMAEAVLCELSLAGPCTSARSAEPRTALPSLDRIRLDPNLDFIVRADGVIELTEVGFRRMVQAHSAGLDAVIGVDGREVLRLPAPKLARAPRAAGSRQAIEPRCAELIEAHVRRTHPVAELLKAEESSEAALNMINKERERHEIESMLPWHAAGTLGRRDAERVERALAEDGELARRYELVREELAETIRLNEMLGAPSARAMEKLFAAIDAEEARAPNYPARSTPAIATG
jgi:hypothetical protein